VHDAPVMYVDERVRDPRAEPRALSWTERSATQDVGERRAVDKLHYQVGLITDDTRVQKSDKAGVLEPFERADLLSQAASELGITRPDDLDRDSHAAALVDSPVDVGHPTLSQQPGEAIMSGEEVR
jgi:hypothetical protein